MLYYTNYVILRSRRSRFFGALVFSALVEYSDAIVNMFLALWFRRLDPDPLRFEPQTSGSLEETTNVDTLAHSATVLRFYFIIIISILNVHGTMFTLITIVPCVT